MNRLNKLKTIQKLRFTRIIPDRSNPLESLTELEFCMRYRFKKETVLYIFNVILPDLETTALKRGVQIPKILQLLVALRFYATGTFQSVLGDMSSLSQGTICTIVKRVSHCIAKYTNRFIQFPTFQEAAKHRSAFYDIAGFPGKT
jgi:nuclease HARBI1